MSIVDEVELRVRNSQPCPLCAQYGGSHQANCEYLRIKGITEPVVVEGDEPTTIIPTSQEVPEPELKTGENTETPE